jgi:hypothetical protein
MRNGCREWDPGVEYPILVSDVLVKMQTRARIMQGLSKATHDNDHPCAPLTTLFKTTLNTTAHMPMLTRRTYDGRADIGGSSAMSLLVSASSEIERLGEFDVGEEIEEDDDGGGDG